MPSRNATWSSSEDEVAAASDGGARIRDRIEIDHAAPQCGILMAIVRPSPCERRLRD
jgi:hypothetical protein